MKNVPLLVFTTFLLLFSTSKSQLNASNDFQNNMVLQRGIDKVISDSKLIEIMIPINDEIIEIKNNFRNGNKEDALRKLSEYFLNKMSDRYYFDWKNFKSRFDNYKKSNAGKLESHYKRANEHMSLFTSNPQWVIPSKGKDGSEISAYKLRHLARQHKAVDIAYVYYLENESEEYLDYLVGQVNSLADNYYSGEYDKKGNAIFESFRAGYRIYNWLFIYNSLLASEKFTWRNQIDYIKTFYYHAKELEHESEKFRFGNHQTKGLVSLALISMLFPEFECSSENLNNSFDVLTEHLTKEIKPDGFQFERTVHYHIGDINNYFYVYQMAKQNNIDVPDEFYKRFHIMFDALVQLAMPNKKLPVLQDDTDAPWAEYNDMGSVMSIGAILFEDPKYKYFASSRISSSYFWLFRETDVNKFNLLGQVSPTLGSTIFPESGYYVMRNGWEKNSQYLIISAGLSDKKPDHQHGDMLGIYAYADENIILPNYQCRYFLHDYSYFKNSFVKNVALVDSIPQGQKWKGNSGGSGFGKWKSLPEPQVIHWQDNEEHSLFIGSHNGYENLDISYLRMVIFIKDGFYIVKDEFKNTTNTEHLYQQVWQGNYSEESNNKLLRSTFQNGNGLDIYQLYNENYSIVNSDARGKGSTIISSKSNKNFSFLTLLSPFRHFENRLIIDEYDGLEKFGNWKNHITNYESDTVQIESSNIITKGNVYYLFGLTEFKSETNLIELNDNKCADFKIMENGKSLEILSLNPTSVELKLSKTIDHKLTEEKRVINLKPGETVKVQK